jgi:hypothetical protein
MKNIRTIALLSLSWLGFSAAAAQAASFQADLDPLNNSGVDGTVLFELSEDQESLTVIFEATGFEPNQPHVGHIHGQFAMGNPVDSMVPTLAQDADDDGFIELAEGATVYGPIVLPLETVNTPDGSASYTETYDLSDSSTFASNVLTEEEGDSFNASDLFPLTFREVIYHGLSVDAGIGAGTPGEVDGTGGYLAVLPVAAAPIVATPEPGATGALVLAGLGGFYGFRRRRQNKSVQ